MFWRSDSQSTASLLAHSVRITDGGTVYTDLPVTAITKIPFSDVLCWAGIIIKTF